MSTFGWIIEILVGSELKGIETPDVEFEPYAK